jgi:hypothetical protein
VRAWGGFAAVPLIAAGCAFPDYAFEARNDVGVTVDSATSPGDTNVVSDSSSDVIFPTDDTSMPPGDSTVTMMDTTVVDTGTPPDTTPVMDTAPPKMGCAALSSMFCRDWDSSGATAFTGWMGNYIRGGGSITVDTSVFRSGPRAMMSTIPASDGVTEVSANVDQQFTAPSATKGWYYDFWARFETIPSISGPLVAKVSRYSSGRGLALYLGKDHLGVDAMGPSGTTGYQMVGTLTPGAWVHIRLEGVLSTTSGSFKLFVNDMVTPNISKSGIPTTSADGTDVKINLGFYNSEPDPSTRKAYFDDVQFDWM